MQHRLRITLVAAAAVIGLSAANAAEQHVAILGDNPDNGVLRASQQQQDLVVNEDFSALTAGSMDAPLPIVEYWQDPETPVPSQYTSEAGWTTTNIYDAGDGHALLKCTNPFFISSLRTPAGDYSGNVTVQIKLRSLYTEYVEGMGVANGGQVIVTPCFPHNPYAMPETDMSVPMFQYNIWPSQGWTLLTMTFQNRSADNDMVIQLQANCDLLVDYVTVACDDSYLASPAPTANPVTSLADDSFSISWQPMRSAHDYYVHLFTVEGTDENGNPNFVPATYEGQWNDDYDPPYNYWWRSNDNQTTSCVVTGIDPEKEYWYCVQAHNVNQFSDYDKRYYAMHVPAPKLLPATEIDDATRAYTANWTPISKGDKYIVGNYGVYAIPEDVTDFPLLEEDFSGLSADFTDAVDISGAEIYTGNDESFLDQFTALPGWLSAYPMYAQGMVGAYPGGMGQVNTPRLWVANADKVSVSLDIVGSTDEQNVQIGFGGEFYAIQINAGDNSLEFELPTNGVQESALTFYTTGQDPFLLDNISVSQDLTAGSTLYVFREMAMLDSGASSHRFETEGMDEYDNVAFRVIAAHLYDNPVTHKTEQGYSAFGGYQLVSNPNVAMPNNVLISDNLRQEGSAAYYDLIGRRVAEPANGVFIKVLDGKASKVRL